MADKVRPNKSFQLRLQNVPESVKEAARKFSTQVSPPPPDNGLPVQNIPTVEVIDEHDNDIEEIFLDEEPAPNDQGT